MSWLRWLPWRFVIRQAARSQGFLDPIELLARLRNFAQPSEVGEPVELLRAGVVFHARGLINSKVIQHNLDWVWPYWIERQFDPHDASFVPRSFSISHINLTHRNWTALGYPDCDTLPLVDPRGLLTPLYDGWSLDAWIIADDGAMLLPSRARVCEQIQEMDTGLAVATRTRSERLALETRASVRIEAGRPVCQLSIEAAGTGAGWLVLALRPCNAEGVSFIHEVELDADRRGWRIDGRQRVGFDRSAARHHVSDYRDGDVYIHLADKTDELRGRCDLGLVTAAAMFPLGDDGGGSLRVDIPLDGRVEDSSGEAWSALRRRACRLECPEPHFRYLFDAAITSLILHSPDEVYPGPYTYKRFWFRDAAFIIHALLCAGFDDRAERALARFTERQTALGYFRSQEGEWDANGEVLWILRRFERLTGRKLGEHWRQPIRRGARWIMRKRQPDDLDAPHAGLLPAGFSAEHLGPNDYYYWDDFWCIAGLRAASELLADSDPHDAAAYRAEADDFAAAVDRSLAACAARLGRPGMPASPYRRLDAGAIGSIALGYPLAACEADDPRLLDCVEFLLERCFVDGAFFQDMIHSGLNAYLTLEVAQVLLRAGDPRYLELIDAVAELASPTGQWPEAIHPRTGGGCMGDGHHVWAAAEWLLMLRNCFVREEGDRLVLCSGVPIRWLEAGEPVRFGPAPTDYGVLTITLTPLDGGAVRLDWDPDWRGDEPPIDIRLPGFDAISAAPGSRGIELRREGMPA